MTLFEVRRLQCKVKPVFYSLSNFYVVPKGHAHMHSYHAVSTQRNLESHAC